MEAIVTLRFKSMDDAVDFVTEAKSRGMLHPANGLRRASSKHDLEPVQGFDRLVVSTSGLSCRPWMIPPGRTPMPGDERGSA